MTNARIVNNVTSTYEQSGRLASEERVYKLTHAEMASIQRGLQLLPQTDETQNLLKLVRQSIAQMQISIKYYH